MPRKQLSGCQKRKKRKRDEELRKSQAGAMLKFLQKQPQGANVVEEHVHGKVDEHNVHANVDANVEENVVGANVKEDDVVANVEKDVVGANVKEDDVDVAVNEIDIFDPRNWGGLKSNMINVLVEEGPKRDLTIDKGPKNKSGRRFSATLYTRTLANKETCDRSWLVYSKELDKVFCFCCKLFRKGVSKGQLDNEGYGDWKHVTSRLKEHETGFEHLKNMTTWYEMRQRLKANKTGVQAANEQFKK
ncbi:zinc finger MYM-type protein 5-like [Helianthus annuus]|uniref:zinc finger MYM-type protein 5-like n=1 Tax=Helianthus annuus TaxID=4232 RepID=UPI000B8F03AA|nr:zinc finger MYM-type protein 5-like [Helianthus annuus]